ncbi:MAG: DUF255 domain-containing protein [Polyangiaceae bacterium]
MRKLVPFLVAGLSGCLPAAVPASVAAPAPADTRGGLVREGTPDDVNLAKARAEGRKVLVDWQPWSPETFARAKREHKFILVDGSAEWCHWCHVMDAMTYADGDVSAALAKDFVAIRVDIDERPDLAERYQNWGWPATILLSPDAEEIGKFRGYIAKEDLLPILAGVATRDRIDEGGREPSAPLDALPWMFAKALAQLDSYYDEAEGGWGARQKSPIGDAAELCFRLAIAGDTHELEHGARGLRAQRALIDRVDGGIYQYSAATDWNSPHYEKLMTVQASNLEAYALAYAYTKDESFLADAKDVARYMNGALSGADGAFYVTQDADVNAHDPSKPFIDGEIYYTKDRAGRAALGAPRVDDSVYALENGIAISAMVALYEASGDAAYLERARRAADRILRTHVSDAGAVMHQAGETRGVYFLADVAGFGRGVARLAEVTGDATYRDAALRIAAYAESAFVTEDGAGLYGQTEDAHAVGVFARRPRPFGPNVLAARFEAALFRLTGDPAHERLGKEILAGISTPSGLENQGRVIGSYAIALFELRSAPKSIESDVRAEGARSPAAPSTESAVAPSAERGAR